MLVTQFTSKECLSLIMTGCTASSARMMTFCIALNSSLVASGPTSACTQQATSQSTGALFTTSGWEMQAACAFRSITDGRPMGKVQQQ